MKKYDNRGFTMAELLIVVAIIAVLVAVAIPVFNSQLKKASGAVVLSNLRNAYAQAAEECLGSNNPNVMAASALGYEAYGETITVIPVEGVELKDGLSNYFDSASDYDLPFDASGIAELEGVNTIGFIFCDGGACFATDDN